MSRASHAPILSAVGCASFDSRIAIVPSLSSLSVGSGLGLLPSSPPVNISGCLPLVYRGFWVLLLLGFLSFLGFCDELDEVGGGFGGLWYF